MKYTMRRAWTFVVDEDEAAKLSTALAVILSHATLDSSDTETFAKYEIVYEFKRMLEGLT